MKKITRQKVYAVLRKAKQTRAVYTPSIGVVGMWSSGYQVEAACKGEYHILYTSYRNIYRNQTDSKLAIYLKAIVEAGIAAEIKEVELGVLKKKVIVIKIEQEEGKSND